MSSALTNDVRTSCQSLDRRSRCHSSGMLSPFGPGTSAPVRRRLLLAASATRTSWLTCLSMRADTCAICRNKLYEPSIEAQASEHARPAPPVASPFSVCVATPPSRARPWAGGRCGLQHRVGMLRPRLPPRLHLAVAQNSFSLPLVQPRVGVRTRRFERNGGGLQCWRPRVAVHSVALGQRAFAQRAFATGLPRLRPVARASRRFAKIEKIATYGNLD